MFAPLMASSPIVALSFVGFGLGKKLQQSHPDEVRVDQPKQINPNNPNKLIQTIQSKQINPNKVTRPDEVSGSIQNMVITTYTDHYRPSMGTIKTMTMMTSRIIKHG